MTKISIVMSYFNNRKTQAKRTLDYFQNNYLGKYNFEVVIVDDNANEENKLNDIFYYYHFPIKYIVISKEEKGDRINPCGAYNKGFWEASGEIVIIQNPECLHVGDILGFTLRNLNPGKYLTFSCYNLCEALMDELINFPNKFEKINDPNFNNRNADKQKECWFNHPYINRTDYHFCSAIYKKQLEEIGGFNLDFAYGSCYDDDEFIYRIKNERKLDVICVPPTECFVIHQYHPSREAITALDYERINKNKTLFEQRFGITSSK
jgi:hypothetical protein